MMRAWRRYTGTQRLQGGWSLVCLLFVGVAVTIDTVSSLSVPSPLLSAVVGGLWLAGLVLLGLRERRQWNEMVDGSSFSQQIGPHATDIETIVEGRSVTATTTVPSLLSQTHTEVSTTITDVDASFTVTFELTDGESRGSVTTGVAEIDQKFAIQGSEQNVARILSPEVTERLAEIETPGVCTVTGDEVTYEVPFTALTPEELETLATAVVAVAIRVEDIGQGGS
jgi:hypothetical protein